MAEPIEPSGVAWFGIVTAESVCGVVVPPEPSSLGGGVEPVSVGGSDVPSSGTVRVSSSGTVGVASPVPADLLGVAAWWVGAAVAPLGAEDCDEEDEVEVALLAVL